MRTDIPYVSHPGFVGLGHGKLLLQSVRDSNACVPGVDLAVAIDATALQPELLDQSGQSFVGDRALASGTRGGLSCYGSLREIC